jgi:hypothetical protein
MIFLLTQTLSENPFSFSFISIFIQAPLIKTTYVYLGVSFLRNEYLTF